MSTGKSLIVKTNVTETSSDDTSSQSGCDEVKITDGSSSLAFDIAPSEVIVKGRNVKKIKMKFNHPRQQSGDTEAERSMSGVGSRHSSAVSLSSASGQQPQEHGDDSMFDPLYQQDVISNNSTSMPSTCLFKPHPPSHSSIHLPEIHKPSSVTPSEPAQDMLSLNIGMKFGTFEWDSKIKSDIINGIEYFERKNIEVKEINERLVKELERVTKLNYQMEERLKLLSEQHKMTSIENDELKIKLDQKEKDCEKCERDVVEQWKARVKAEEVCMEVKRDTESEIKSLKQQLDSKDKQLTKLLSNHTSARSLQRKPSTATSDTLTKSYKYNYEDHLELLHKISQLEEEITRIKSEKERIQDSSKRSKDDVDGLKVKLKDQSSEIETQYKRFLSLKKSFNDISSENDKLKLQLQVRGRKNPTVNVNNNTWPKNMAIESKAKIVSESGANATNETVSYFDLPNKFNKSSTVGVSNQSPSCNKPKVLVNPAYARHKRVNSDGRGQENLPPVTHPVK